LANRCNRGQDWQGGQDEIRAALQRKEEENAILQQTVKEYERKWVSYEAKMKSMEEMWMKQIATLQQNLSDTAKGIVKYGEQDGGSVHHSEGNTPDVTPRSETNTSRSEFNPSRSVINQLAKELEQHTQVFNDDVGFLVEVKSGPVEANFKPSEELQKLNLKFELWKKDFKVRLKETKNILKKLGKSDSAEAKKKKWWGVK
jgi:myosin-5